jgi:hypothetical protein
MEFKFTDIELVQFAEVLKHFDPKSTFAIYMGRSPQDTASYKQEQVEQFMDIFKAEYNSRIQNKF